MLSARGVDGGAWVTALQTKQLRTPSRIISTACFRSAVPAPPTYPAFAVSEHGSFTGVSAVGTGAFLGEHISEVRDIWDHATSRHSRNVMSQLEGVQIEEDLCSEVSENLMQASETMRGDW